MTDFHTSRHLDQSSHVNAIPPHLLAAEVGALREMLERVEAKVDGLHDKPDPDRLLTKEEVAERLQVSPRTVDTLAAAGDIPRIKIRGCVRFHPGAVVAYIDRQARER